MDTKETKAPLEPDRTEVININVSNAIQTNFHLALHNFCKSINLTIRIEINIKPISSNLVTTPNPVSEKTPWREVLNNGIPATLYSMHVAKRKNSAPVNNRKKQKFNVGRFGS